MQRVNNLDDFPESKEIHTTKEDCELMEDTNK